MTTNLFGVVNGISAFLPVLEARTEPSAIVITGSTSRSRSSSVMLSDLTRMQANRASRIRLVIQPTTHPKQR